MLLYVVLAATMAISVAEAKSDYECREIPSEIIKCMGSPRFIPPVMFKGCTPGSECDRMTCVFTNGGWVKDGQLDRRKIIEQYDQFMKDHPIWTRAIQQAKTDCVYADLPSQGVCLESPAYDVSLCTLRNLMQYAEPSQWSTMPNCTSARQYAKECPPCPAECFSQFVPKGACNSCLMQIPSA